MKIQQLQRLSRDKVYGLATKKRITNKTPTEGRRTRTFPIGGSAYQWTNEKLFDLRKQHQLDLEGRSMLVVAASGDPLATFACLNAGPQVGFDTSHRAILWDEFKLEAIKKLDFNEFRDFMGLNDNSGEKWNEYLERVTSGLSKYAKGIFGPLLRGKKSIAQFRGSRFFRGCSGFFPNSNIYSTNEEDYQKARENLNVNRPVIVPGGLDVVLKLTEEKFGGFYGSNILDHFLSNEENEEYDFKAIEGFIKMIDSKMGRKPVMVLQFEWDDDVREFARKNLERLGYEFKLAEDLGGRGYGQIAVARKA